MTRRATALPPPPATASAAENQALRRVLRGAWPSLPALAVAGAAVCAAGTLAVLLAPGVTPVSVLVAAVLAGPWLAALGAAADRIAADGEAGIRDWWRGLRALWRFGAAQALVPAVPAAAFLAALAVWQQTQNPWLLPSLAAGGTCAVAGLLALPAALSLGSARPALRGRLLWLCAAHLVARHPARFLAAPSLALLGLAASLRWTASLLLLVPPLVALVASAATATALARHDAGAAGGVEPRRG
ncbi:hypothetical protein O7599_03280 [Streptomyces sp. WMMC500]|uniref:hypothetical protein n=1 Tax=Streptomyces sp. WMMC500 TaxID=3015154 RepID=UPI00248C8B29|nr:hypothetical protein [Streptomyces sp. WMMC500]WBB61593.1 hypothetical protein O7599_03280 [Streptomyces sp. WMMC500]